MKYVLSIDIGTSEIKVALFSENLILKKITSSKNKVVYSTDGKSEIDMDLLWKNCKKQILKLLGQSNNFSRNIICIGITANMVGLWPINIDGKPVRKAILWNDYRTAEMMEKMKLKDNKIYEKIFNESGSVMQYGCTIPLVKWFQTYENRNFKNTKWFLSCKDWIRFKLTDTIANDYTETVVAPGNAKKINRSNRIYKLFKISNEAKLKFPKIKKSDSIGGYITKKLSKQINIKVGTPVVVGAGDVPSSIIGLGANKIGSAATIFGTTIHNCYISKSPIFYPKNIGLLFYAPNSTWLKTMINIAGTINLDWAIKNFFDFDDYMLNKKKYLLNLEKKIQKLPIGSKQLIFLPYINFGGVIAPFHNENATGILFGLNHKHNKYDILRSIYEGVVLSIVDCYKALNKKIDKLFLAGGGSNSKVWAQMISDAMNVRVVIPEGSEFGAKGAAIIALNTIQRKKWNNKKNNIKIKKQYFPNKKNNILFNAIYKNYKLLSRKNFSDI